MVLSNEDQVFEVLLDYLRQVRGFDFTGYKRSSLQRRVRKQMQSRGIASFGDYLDYLEVHPEEFVPLFNTILINVTSFFRDPSPWEYLSSQILPPLLADLPAHEHIRVWSAGCASGEEAYTLAMVLAELLGLEQFRERVRIYATDVDEEALGQARLASYSSRALQSIPADLRDKYFEPQPGDRYVFRYDLRRSVIFGRHDLLQDAPISRLTLLVCRNALMYFNAEAQARILARFHFALKDTGVLFLGKAEMLLTHANLFAPISLQYRIFTKVPKLTLRDRLLVLTQDGDEEVSDRLSTNIRLWNAAFNAVSIAQIIIDLNGSLILANSHAQLMFGIPWHAMGRPFQDLEISYRPVELRSQIEQVYTNRQPVLLSDVPRHLSDGSIQYLEVQLCPLYENDVDPLGVSITFTDTTRYHGLRTELQRANQELETANEELQSTNEELETTNEELQSTNEELETTNEELQSTNEELETMNEELQSTNEELQTINDELQQRTEEVNHVNSFLNSILVSISAGMVVMGNQFNILSWNGQAENLWGLRAEEVEQRSFFSLDIGLPVDQLHDIIRRCMAGEDHLELVIDAVNRRGKRIQCKVTCSPLMNSVQEREGVILVMEEVENLVSGDR